MTVSISVADRIHWIPIRIRILIEIRIQGNMTKNLQKFAVEKSGQFLIKKLQLPYSLASITLQENIQLFKTLNFWTFLSFFLFLWVIFALLDPDPDSGSGSTDFSSPDPQHWYLPWLICLSVWWCLVYVLVLRIRMHRIRMFWASHIRIH